MGQCQGLGIVVQSPDTNIQHSALHALTCTAHEPPMHTHTLRGTAAVGTGLGTSAQKPHTHTHITPVEHVLPNITKKGVRFDKNDRAIRPNILHEIEKELGIKFTVDACCNPSGDNAFVPKFCDRENSFLK